MSAGQRVIALASLSGAGKTTLVRSVSGSVDFTHLSASDLIKEQITREEGIERSSEALRSVSIPGNQIRLVESYRARASNISGHIVLDCHTIIDTPSGLEDIPASIFEAIGITDLLFLVVDPTEISKRRSRDTFRSRPYRTVCELAEQQKIALHVAREISGVLDIPFTILRKAPETELLSMLKSCSNSGK